MRKDPVRAAGKHVRQQLALPATELQRLTRGASDRVLGDGDQRLGEVSDERSEAAGQVAEGDRGQPARWPALRSRRSRNLSIFDWLSTMAMPSFARSAGVSPSWFIHLRIESSVVERIPTAGCA